MNPVCMPAFTRHDIEIIDIQSRYSGYCSIQDYFFKFKLFEGGYSPYLQREIVSRAPAASVLLFDPIQDNVILIEQIRIGALEDPNSPWLLEIVAGIIDHNESFETCAHREAIEEAGQPIIKLIHILDYWVSPGTSNEKTRIFCGLIDIQSSHPAEKKPPAHSYHGVESEGENIKAHQISSKDAFLLVRTGKITTAPAIIALQWLELNHTSLLSEHAASQDNVKLA